MHKFSAEFDMNRLGWILVSEDPAANAIARFQHNDFAAGDAEIKRCSKTSGARPDDQNIRSFVSEIRVVINYHYIGFQHSAIDQRRIPLVESDRVSTGF